MTLQEVFDNTWNWHVRDKNGPGRNADSGSCFYRSVNGCRCGIGASIPDEMYDESMEGYGVGELAKRFPEVATLFAIEDRSALTVLQDCHDLSAKNNFHPEYESRLRDFAAKYQLAIPA